MLYFTIDENMDALKDATDSILLQFINSWDAQSFRNQKQTDNTNMKHKHVEEIFLQVIKSTSSISSLL